MHGDTICRMITEREHPAMVLMLTASGTPAQRVSGLGLGADDYLSKPFHLPELVLRIRALARRRPTAQPRILRAAGIELDPLHHTATRDGRRLDLSAKEFAVLEDADARPELPSSAQKTCFAQVWDENVDPFSNTVHVTISRLRRKLGEPPAIDNDHQRRLPPGPEYRLGSARPCPCTHSTRSAIAQQHICGNCWSALAASSEGRLRQPGRSASLPRYPARAPALVPPHSGIQDHRVRLPERRHRLTARPVRPRLHRARHLPSVHRGRDRESDPRVDDAAERPALRRTYTTATAAEDSSTNTGPPHQTNDAARADPRAATRPVDDGGNHPPTVQGTTRTRPHRTLGTHRLPARTIDYPVPCGGDDAVARLPIAQRRAPLDR